jgi:site-specific DNA recombinase
MTQPAKLRCAVYTRKSSEEGLEQGFNSLHAQREACEAYIRSQVGEGWVLLRTAYDDGGFSGGSMDRPALKALMAEIEAGRIDVVVVYKVDRLTRSLMDFARMVETFDRKGVSFVSITQSFNTTTSMGRLTLNVLLSFAQFEREVTGERIRDKIAASKVKGMWMGGNPALGYDVEDRRLIVNPAEAATVRTLFERYRCLGTVHALKEELDRSGVRSKAWVSQKGRSIGGQSFSRGALFHLLKNRLYIGEVVHKDRSYPGQHAAIVDRDLFDVVQAGLLANAATRRDRPTKSSTAPLIGLIFDQDGEAMTPTFGYGQGGSAFRYYVSASLQQGARRTPGDDAVRRVSAPQIEALVLERMRRLTSAAGWADVAPYLQRVNLRPHCLQLTLQSAGLLDGRGADDLAVAALSRRLEPDDRLQLDADGILHLTLAVRPVFRGGRTWLVNPNGAAAIAKARVDAGLVSALRKAHAILLQHNAAPSAALTVQRGAISPADNYARKLAELAFLAPDIQQAIFEGRQPPGLTARQIMERGIPLAWPDQRAMFGFPC